MEAADTPAKVPWPSWLGVLLAIILFFVGQVGAVLLVGFYYVGLRGWTRQRALDQLQNGVSPQFAYQLISVVIILAAIYWFVKAYKRRPNVIGLRRPAWSDPLYSIAAFPIYLIILVTTINIVKAFIPALNVSQAQDVGFNGTYHGSDLVLVFLTLVILPPLVEETLFRGLLYSSFKKSFGLWTAAILTSLIFAAGHLPEGGAAGPLYVAGIDTFVLSMILIYLRQKTGGLWAGIGLHALKNGIAFLSIFVLHLH